MKEFVEVEYRTGRVGYFNNPQDLFLLPDTNVVVPVERGVDLARVVHSAIHNPNCTKVNPDELQDIVRVATNEDLDRLVEVEKKEQNANDKFLELVVKYPFDMKLFKTIYQFDENKLTFFFTADGRVDFRDFVRELAANFRTRIELHQITGRDVAKNIGGMGMCGKGYCCSTFLKQFSQITIKMAKDQNLSGNLSKISGPCGRLLCCLHYEENYYAEAAKDFPEVGDEVFYNDMKMYVYKNDYYNNNVHLTTEDQISETISLAVYTKLRKPKKRRS